MNSGKNVDRLKDFAGIENRRKQNSSVLKIIVKLMNQFYWKKLLKGNAIFEEESFAKPYGR